MPLSKGGGGVQSSTMFFILNRNGIPDLFLEAATSDTHRQDTGWFLIASRINRNRYWASPSALNRVEMGFPLNPLLRDLEVPPAQKMSRFELV